MFACVCLACCFSACVFCLRCLLHFFVLPTKNAEAGTKGDMSYLDALDA